MTAVEQIPYRSSAIQNKEDRLPSEALLNQRIKDLLDRLAPPPVEIPRRDYSQRNNPELDKIDLPLAQHILLMSKKAREEWINWISNEEDIIKLLLDEYEYELYLSIKEEYENMKQEGLELEMKDMFLATKVTPKFIEAKITDIEASSGNRTINEINELADKSILESIGRLKTYDIFDPSFLDPRRDPDFVSPISTSLKSRGGFLVKLASRPFNLKFKITYTTSSSHKSEITRPKVKKDYTTIQDIEYLIIQNKKYEQKEEIRSSIDGSVSKIILRNKNESCIIEQIDPEFCKFETDLRLSPKPELELDGVRSLIPNPKNYKKIDCDSLIGLKLLNSFKQNPYHEWEEVSWDWNGERKVAFVREIPCGLAWAYLDKSEIASNKKMQRIIYPQITEIWDKTYESKASYLIGYRIRSSDYQELEYPFKNIVKEQLGAAIDKLKENNYVFVSKTPHDVFGAIVYSFVRNDLKTAKSRYETRLS